MSRHGCKDHIKVSLMRYSIVIDNRLDWSSVLSREKEFSFYHHVHSGCGVCSGSYIVGFPGDKAAVGAKLTMDIIIMLMLRMCGTVPPVPICFYDVIVYKDSFTVEIQVGKMTIFKWQEIFLMNYKCLTVDSMLWSLFLISSVRFSNKCIV